MTEIQKLFLEFIQLRENARLAKERGISPHTDDPIIANYSFCNINREHDRVTKWVKREIRDIPYKYPGSLIWHVLLARIFNEPTVLELILPWKGYQKTLKQLQDRKAGGDKVFRGVYKMLPHGPKGIGVCAIEYYMTALRAVDALDFRGMTYLEDIATALQTVRGIGPFVANQVVTDLRYTHAYKDAADWETFVLCGPGTKKGLKRFFGEKPRKGGSQKTALDELAKAQAIISPHLDEPFTSYFRDPNNLTNSFCEFSKYTRALEGGANPKKKYASDIQKH